MSNIIAITETFENKVFWLEQGLAGGHLDAVTSADALIVPEKDFREGVPFVFHQDTTVFFQYLETNLKGQFSIELLADDDEYIEVSLHSSSFRFNKIIVSHIAAPIILGLMTNYIYDYLKAKPTDRVEASIVLENHECKSFKFDFNGEAKDFSLLADQVGEMARNCENASSNKVLKEKK